MADFNSGGDSTIELQPRRQELSGGNEQLGNSEGEAPDHGGFASLPPVDRGRDAYLFLAAAFWMELLVWGKSTCFNLIFTEQVYFCNSIFSYLHLFVYP